MHFSKVPALEYNIVQLKQADVITPYQQHTKPSHHIYHVATKFVEPSRSDVSMSNPPFRNPWSHIAPVPDVNVYDPTDSIWPDRLLHVPTMTSFKGELLDGQHFFGKTPNPRYNVLSYTWGFYRDDEGNSPTISVHGLPWKVPPIKPEHFTPHQFHNAIKNAARGVVKKPCEWLWVDIACIPQEDRTKSKDEDKSRLKDELRLLSAQEVGRQVAIFKRAEESFVWLTCLTNKYLQEKGSNVRVQALENYVMNLGSEASAAILKQVDLQVPAHLLPREVHLVRRQLGGANSIDIAAYFVLLQFAHEANLFSTWINCILDHRWCMSLWTLQEMVLRPDAWLLLDDGLLDVEKDQGRLQGVRFKADMMRDFFRTQGITPNESGKWCLSDIKFEIFQLNGLLNGRAISRMWDGIKSIETRLKDRLPPDLRYQIPSVAGIQERLSNTLRLMELKGLNALHVSFPHTAYSAARHRRSEKTVDRIWGIVQTYGISCQPLPLEDERADEEKLKDLQDDFGTQLVSKMPVLSQLFIHNLGREGGQPQNPRRSWLITEKCDVEDGWWSNFESGYKIVNLFESFQAIQDSGTLRLKFKGRAWDIDNFVNPVPLTDGIRFGIFNSLFKPLKDADSPTSYNGLMLDQNVSLAVLRDSSNLSSNQEAMEDVDSICLFRSEKDMKEAVAKLKDYYGKDLRVASLGCSYIDDLPHVQHVGIVLAPSPLKRSVHDRGSRMEAAEVWCRIGLWRWIEDYSPGCAQQRHPQLPSPDEFSCLIE